MLLSDSKSGDKVKLESINSGVCMRNRLISMGLFIGSEMEVITSSGQGPIVISVQDSRLALGHNMARKMTVSSL